MADKVHLWLVVKGSSMVTGRSAVSKAREVSKLVSELKALGIAESDIEVQGVRAEVSSGILTKSSSASYTLRVGCFDLDRLADVLDTAAAQKNVVVERLEWGYADQEEEETRCLESCLVRARKRAERMAAALGSGLGGVYNLTHTTRDDEAPDPFPASDGMYRSAGAGRARTGIDLGVEVTHRKRVHYKVHVEFHCLSADARPNPPVP